MLNPFFELVYRCTVRLDVPDGQGTAFFVAPGLILTCAHVVESVKDDIALIKVHYDNQDYSAESIQFLEKPYPDLALLRIDISDHPCVYLDPSVNPGDQLFAFGYPGKSPGGESCTLDYEGPAWIDSQKWLLKFKGGQVVGGYSGSPLVNMRTWGVCGIIKKSRDEYSDLGGGGVSTSVILTVFPELTGLQNEFHREDTRWKDARKEQIGLLEPSPFVEPKKESLWNVPYDRNPFFTGRKEIIKELRQTFLKDRFGISIQVLSGIGGVGKTQIAVEYAYSYQESYKAIFWVKANSDLEIQSSFLEIAATLNLPEKNVREANRVVIAVKNWLKAYSGWFLIFDNADNPKLIKGYVPVGASGHILLTSRAHVFQELGIVKPVEITKLTPPESLEFFIKRTGREDNDIFEKGAAEELAKELEFFPLALEQASAYITAKEVRFQDYLAGYQKRRLELLEKQKPIIGDYPHSVATTWKCNFEEVEKDSKASADLLYFSAFLYPDDIPLELITGGTSLLGSAVSEAFKKARGDVMVIDTLLEPLTRYSLIRRNVLAQTYSLHRLVQDEVKRRIGEKRCRIWAERTVRAINQVFPEVDFTNWPLCERLVSQGIAANLLSAEYSLEFAEAARLFYQVGSYLQDRGRYAEAEPLYQRALEIVEKTLEPEHPEAVLTLSHLARFYSSQCRHAEAESLDKRVLAIVEKELGPEHHVVASAIDNLAGDYENEGKDAEAESLYKRALAIKENVLGPEHIYVATSLNNLAWLYVKQGRYAEAEPLYKRALAIREKMQGPEHPDVATCLNNLAVLYDKQGKDTQAGPLFKRALEIREKMLGPDHLDVAFSLNTFASFLTNQGKYADAEPLYKRALAISGKVLGPDHPTVDTVLRNYADLLRKMNRIDEAIELENHAQAIQKKQSG